MQTISSWGNSTNHSIQNVFFLFSALVIAYIVCLPFKIKLNLIIQLTLGNKWDFKRWSDNIVDFRRLEKYTFFSNLLSLELFFFFFLRIKRDNRQLMNCLKLIKCSYVYRWGTDMYSFEVLWCRLVHRKTRLIDYSYWVVSLVLTRCHIQDNIKWHKNYWFVEK